ncbi:cysteine hydrolase family protein (plasmid) [Lachnospiraceae bacterium C1.1]|nr:isochorismatase family cysteine hydrolase [Lachnospiraceae bacterium C1.1]
MNRILVVVDMQNDFVTGALRNEEAIAIVPNLVEKVKNAIEDNDIVIFTKDTHLGNYMETEEGKNLPVPHCIDGTEGWEIIDELIPYTEGRPVIKKYTFGATELGEELRKQLVLKNIEKIEIVGVCTDVCVISNAMVTKAYLPNIPICVDAACCAGISPEGHDTALNAMKATHIHISNEGKEPWRKYD